MNADVESQQRAMELIAHRGASHDAPENTLAAIHLAWHQNADAVEVDVHLCSDGHIVVMHDHDTRRTTGVRGKLSDLSLAEIKRLDAGSWKGEQFMGERVPVLDQVLAQLPADKRLYVEIKDGESIVGPLAHTVERSGVLPEQVVVIGFDFAVVRAAKTALPQCEVLWLRGVEPQMIARRAARLEELIRACRDAGLDGLDLSHSWPMNRAFVERVEAANLKVYAWTVNDLSIARRLAEAGVHGLTTDRPGWLREQLALV